LQGSEEAQGACEDIAQARSTGTPIATHAATINVVPAISGGVSVFFERIRRIAAEQR
jgi:hypothetical protein